MSLEGGLKDKGEFFFFLGGLCLALEALEGDEDSRLLKGVF